MSDALAADPLVTPPPAATRATAPQVDEPPDEPPAYVDSAGREYRDPILAVVVETNELVLGALEDTRQRLENKIGNLEVRLNALQSENAALRLVIEHAHREPGPPGARGPRGPAGPKGEASKIASWRVNAFRFDAAPVYGDGSTGPALELKPILEALAARLGAQAAQS
jgi:hypothetical protein